MSWVPPALEAWGGQAAHVATAQRALLERVTSNRVAVGSGSVAAGVENINA